MGSSGGTGGGAGATAAVAAHAALVDPHGMAPVALRTWHAALANRAYSAAKIVALGGSTVEGQGSTVYGRDLYHQLVGQLRTRFPSSGVTTGGWGLIPATLYSTGISGYPSSLSGGATYEGSAVGWAARTANLSASGSTVTFTLTGATGYRVVYAQWSGAGSFSHAVDGGSPVTVNGYDPTTDRFKLTGLVSVAAGAHTVVVTRVSGTNYIRGLIAYNGDETTGIQLYEGGHSGMTSTSYAGLTSQFSYGITAIQPHLVVIDLGRNDFTTTTQVSPATMRTNIETIISTVRTNCSTTPSIVLYESQQIGTPSGSYTWAEYRAAYEALAAADSGVCIFDLSTRQVSPQTDNALGLYRSDLIHMSDMGHSLVASNMAAFLSPH